MTVLEVISLAMMTAEATPRPLPERSMDSTISSPFSSLIESVWPSTLPAHPRETVRGGTNVFARKHGERVRHGDAPDGRECGVGAEHFSELGDALSGVRATTKSIKATELVAIQTARSTHGQNARR